MRSIVNHAVIAAVPRHHALDGFQLGVTWTDTQGGSTDHQRSPPYTSALLEGGGVRAPSGAAGPSRERSGSRVWEAGCLVLYRQLSHCHVAGSLTASSLLPAPPGPPTPPPGKGAR